MRERRRLARRRHRGQPAFVRGRAARRRRCRPDGRPAARRRRAVRVQRPSPAGSSRVAGARDGVLPVQQHRGRRAVRARRPRARAGDDRRLGRAPRQRDQRHLPRHRPRCCSSRSTSRRCIRAPGPASDVGSGDGRGFTVNLPVRAGRGRPAVLLARRPRRRAAGAVVRAPAHADLGRLRRPPRRSARVMRGDRGGVRRDDALDPLGVRDARGPGRMRARGRVRARRAGEVGGGHARSAERAGGGAGSRCRGGGSARRRAGRASGSRSGGRRFGRRRDGPRAPRRTRYSSNRMDLAY